VRYAEQGDPGGEVRLLVHGWPDSLYSFTRVLELLPPERYQTFSYDQRGFGVSERPESGYAIDDFAADAVVFLDAVGVASAPSSAIPWAASSPAGWPRSRWSASAD
jgi:pimeloyl-ACP methyl ester carboxylesterase